MTNVVEFRKPTASAKIAVILVRVSTKEQEEGYSLDAQRHRLQLYCERRSLDVARIFEIVESSTVGERKKFMEMIRFVERIKQPVAIVADKVDRVQRSFKEFPLLDSLICQGKIELHFNTENYAIHRESASQERMMWSMGVIMAQSYVDSLRDNVKRAIDQKIRNGEFTGLAPLGYVNVRDEKGHANIVIDEPRAALVRKLFEEYASGLYTLGEMLAKTKEWGLTNRTRLKKHLVPSHLHKIINNPFYYGEMRIKDTIYTHRYEPLISRDLWDACQAVLHGWKKKPFKWGGKDFVFRGLITCATTGKMITSATQKKTYTTGETGEWTYLIGYDSKDPSKKIWVREEKVLEQVVDVLGRLQMTQDLHEKIKGYVRQTDRTERDFLRRNITELQKEQTQMQSRMDALMDLLLDNAIERGEYEQKRSALRAKLAKVAERIKAQQNGDDNFKEALISIITIAAEAKELFLGSTNEEKRTLLNYVFSNLTLSGATLCYSLKKPFDMMLNCPDFAKWRARMDSNHRPAA
jgi:site-specific DNA recombinase